MKEIVERFKALIKASSKTIKVLNGYAKLKENPVDNAYILEKRLTELSKTVDTLVDFDLKNQLINWLNQEKKEIEKVKEDFRFAFGERLKALFQQDNQTISGQYPILRIGFYTLVLNFEFGEAILYFGPEVEKIKSKIPLEPEVVYNTFKKIDTELRKTKFDPKEFYLDLKKAYNKCVILSKKPFGEKVYLVDVLSEYVLLKQTAQFFIDPKKENFRGFSRISLSYLLYLFKKSEYAQKGLHLYIATFDATVDRKHAIWIPDNEEGDGTYYSYLSFSEEAMS